MALLLDETSTFNMNCCQAHFAVHCTPRPKIAMQTLARFPGQTLLGDICRQVQLIAKEDSAAAVYRDLTSNGA